MATLASVSLHLLFSTASWKILIFTISLNFISIIRIIIISDQLKFNSTLVLLASISDRTMIPIITPLIKRKTDK